MHDIIVDIVDWDEAHKAYLAGEGATGSRYNQRLEAAEQMAQIEARWEHLPGGFHGQRQQIKIHIQAVAAVASPMSSEEICWLAIAAASAWIPTPTTAQQAAAGHGPCDSRTTRSMPPSASGEHARVHGLHKNQYPPSRLRRW